MNLAFRQYCTRSHRARRVRSRLEACTELIAQVGFLVAAVIDWRAEALPFPAPNLQRCRSAEDCCTPALGPRGDAARFEFPAESSLPVRVRPAAHLVDEEYAAKIQRAYELMRALPDSNGRSLVNQAKLHCAYCDNNFYFEGNEYPLEIHQSWLFLPWHRMFVYFHERILAELIEDDGFALPFWNWDDQSAPDPSGAAGNMVPELYANTTGFGPHGNTSFLYDEDRGECARRPNIVDFLNPFVGCLANKTNATLRTENTHLLYTHMVTGAVTPSLFFGTPYRFGDKGGVGGGTLEMKPHGPVHLWVNVVKMLTNKLSAADPIFYAHHLNVDRLWTVWKGLEGGVREDIKDRDWLDTQFTFYDERGRVVVATVEQSLNIKKLRYKYQKVPTPWVRGAVHPDDAAPVWPPCYNSSTPLLTMINATDPLRSPLPFNSTPVTFRVARTPAGSTSKPNGLGPLGEEVLQLQGKLNWTLPMSFNAFLNFPEATTENASTQGCWEYLGSFVATPHEGTSPETPAELTWRVAVGRKIEDLGVEGLEEVAITLAGPLSPKQTIYITSAEIFRTRD